MGEMKGSEEGERESVREGEVEQMTTRTAIQSVCLSAPLGHYMLTASARLMVDRQTRQEPAASTETDISTSSGTTGKRGVREQPQQQMKRK